MPRNASGACTLAEPAFVPATPIASATMNSDLDDIATMLTDSLSRSGKGGMTATLSLIASGFNYSSDPDTGMNRPSANTQVVEVGGQDYTFTAGDLTAPGGLSLLPLIGELRIYALPTAPTGWIFMRGQAATAADNPLWRTALVAAGSPYGTSGSDPLFPNMQCVLPIGLDASARGLVTGSTVLGALLGAQTVTLGTTNLPPYTPTGSINDGRTWSWPTKRYTIQGGAGAPQDVDDPAGSPQNLDVGVTPTGSISFAGTAQGGVSTPFSVVQPTIVLNFIGRDA